MTVTGTNQKGVLTAVKRRPVGSVYHYRSDDSGCDILMHAHLDKQKIVKLKNIHVHVCILSVGEVHTVHCVLVHTCAQVMPFYINYVYMFMHNIIVHMYMPHTYTTHMPTYNRSSQMKL